MSEPKPTDAAIVGMACIFPGAADLDAYWENLRGGVDAITDVPARRWDPVFYDPESSDPDRFYCKRGGFVDEHATFDAMAWGVMPVAAKGAEPDQLVALEVAARALSDAGYREGGFDRDRAAVVLGRGNYIGAGMTRLEQHVRTAQQLVRSLRELVPDLDEEQLARVKDEFQSKLGGYGPDTAIGLVPNLTASRVANRLDLHGPAYTVDAACASSLLAVDHACRELQSGRADVALAGGVHLSHDVAFWSVFCQLGALSHQERIRPFHRDADGLLIGEGVGVVVLKRVEEARRDGDRIYAVLRGSGVASDGRGSSLMTPRPAGQRLALERAWAEAGVDPSTLGLLEAHGTATPAGDEAELSTVADFFGPAPSDGPRAVIGSVKSMIGHAMPAAGVAGLIKAALAVHHRTLPPTLHCEEPHAGMEATRFRPVAEAEPWEADGHPLRAGVNAFGFGGINAHLVLESDGVPARSRRRRGGRTTARMDRPEKVLRLAAETPEDLVRALDEGREEVGEGPCRLALVDPTPERRDKARDAVLSGKPRRGRDGLWFAPRGMLSDGGKVAFLFPGVEAVFEPRVDDVARRFDRPAPPRVPEGDLERQGAAVVEVGRLLNGALKDLGVAPDAVAGHSVGEWTAMLASGVIPEDALDEFVGTLEAGSLRVPGVVFAAAGAGLDRVGPLVEDLEDVLVTHDNCPHQVIVCGPEERVDVALQRFREARILAQKLPFRSGFHSPVFEPYLGTHREHFERLPLQAPGIPLWSATTAAPFPEEPDAIRALALRHLVRPIRFREVVQRLYDEGVRAFVQVGTGSLVGFVDDTLRGRAHLAMSANAPQRSGLNQLRRLAAALFVEGLDVRWEPLDDQPARPGALSLDLGVPLVEGLSPLEVETSGRASVPAETAGHPVLAGFAEVIRSVEAASGAVEKAWARSPGRRTAAAAASSPANSNTRGGAPAITKPTGAPGSPPAATEKVTHRTLSVDSDPYLLDHCLIPQRPGWPTVEDRNPVVPMTMEIRMMLDAAREVAPDRVPVAVDGVRAYRWLAVEPPVDVVVRARPEGDDRVAVSIDGYVEATVVTAPAYPGAPEPGADPPGIDEEPAVTAQALYDERWMFHGPAYQAVTDLEAIGDDGVVGTLEAMEAPGALLDAAGQLFGYWVMARVERDRLAMPIKVRRMDLYGPEPEPGTPVRCAVHVRRLGVRNVRADMELTVDGHVWARIHGWEDWRFETDDRLWPVMQRTEDHLFADVLDDGVAFLHDPKRSSASRDYLARRFLTSAERAAWQEMPSGARTGWLQGRIVAKDAVRDRLRRMGDEPRFPAEITFEETDVDGVLRARTPVDADLRVAVAARRDAAAAVVVEGRDPAVVLREVPETADDTAAASVLTEDDERWLRRVGDTIEARRRGSLVVAWTSEGT
ncbi:MAG: type I polyketide synthase [Myxococcota bacterium]